MREKEFDAKFQKMIENWKAVDAAYLAAKRNRKQKTPQRTQRIALIVMGEIQQLLKVLKRILGLKS